MGGDDADDLDAFFDDVDKVTEEVEQTEEEPPSKKQKTEENNRGDNAAKPPPPVRPRGVVVAAASSYKTPAVAKEDDSEPKTARAAAVNEPEVVGPALPAAATAGSSQSNSPKAPPQQAASESNIKPKKHVRSAGGKTWVDTSLDDWPDNDFRIFVGNLPGDVSDVALYEHFTRYASLQRAKIIRDHAKNNESKGYGFVSFGDALDCAKAIREMDQTWLGRPIRIKRSTWKDRELNQVRKKERKNKKYQKKMNLL